MTETGNARRLPPVIITFLAVIAVISSLLALGGFAVLTYQGVQNSNAVHAVQAAEVKAIHQDAIDSCRAANATRAKDIAIWNRLLTISPAQKASETPAARREVAQLRALVANKDTPVNCAKLFHIP